MALTTYAPVAGPKWAANHSYVYTLPREAGGGSRGGQMDEGAVVKLDGRDGSMSMYGASRLLIAAGRIEQQFEMNEYWYGHNANADYTAGTGGNMFAARAKAFREMIDGVVLGGNGRLTFTDEDGTVYFANALCVAWSFPRIMGQADSQPTLTFVLLAGGWTDPAGKFVPIF